MSVKSYYDSFYATSQLDLDEAYNSFRKIAPLWQETGESLRVLDIGCGAGAVSSELVKIGHQVWGLDVMDEAVKRACTRGLNAQVHDANERLPFDHNFFDCVLALDVVEHVFDPCRLLKDIVRVLKPDGKIIISVPNHFDLSGRLSAAIGRGIVHPEHQALGFSTWDYCHIRFFTLRELCEMLRNAGLLIEKRIYRAIWLPKRMLQIPIASKIFLHHKVLGLMARLWPSLLASGIVCRVSKVRYVLM